MAAVAELADIWKVYDLGEVKVEALRGINLRFEEADYVAIMGSSGSGKSTLLNILGCLDRPTGGRYLLGGDDVAIVDDDTLSEIRGQRIGFIFQSYNLIQQLTVVENIEVPLIYQGGATRESRESRLPGAWSTTRFSSWPMKRPEISTPAPAKRSWISWRG
jgi:putative ABC transport system ATP-binding protein